MNNLISILDKLPKVLSKWDTETGESLASYDMSTRHIKGYRPFDKDFIKYRLKGIGILDTLDRGITIATDEDIEGIVVEYNKLNLEYEKELTTQVYKGYLETNINYFNSNYNLDQIQWLKEFSIFRVGEDGLASFFNWTSLRPSLLDYSLYVSIAKPGIPKSTILSTFYVLLRLYEEACVKLRPKYIEEYWNDLDIRKKVLEGSFTGDSRVFSTPGMLFRAIYDRAHKKKNMTPEEYIKWKLQVDMERSVLNKEKAPPGLLNLEKLVKQGYKILEVKDGKVTLSKD